VDNIIIFGAKYLVFIVVLVTVAAWFQSASKTKKQFALAVILAGIAAVILAKVAGKLYFHHRPFVLQNITPLVAHGDDNGFPSEHTLLATTLATVIYYYRAKLGIGLFALAIVVGVSRVAAHVHWGIDILSGLILGMGAGWAGYVLSKQLLPGSKQAAVDQKDN
jgi:undecaprenyl-diphosphatase